MNGSADKHFGQRPTPLLSDRFKILSPIDRGGFARIYLAEDTHYHHQRCVIKQLAYHLPGTWADQRAEKLFLQEAQQLQSLGQHPQIPALYAYFTEGNTWYLAQEFIEGHTLLKELKQNGAFSEDQILRVLLNILPVLRDIHEQGVIHRDLKPDNIMRKHVDGTLVLIDFGVSRRFTESMLTQTGTILGSYGYSALEQMKSGKSTPASDLFSLGVSCFQLLTNMVPYTLFLNYGYSWIDQWQLYLKAPISSHMKTILGKLLQNDMRRRYPSAAAVLTDLQTRSSLHHLPIAAVHNSLSQLSRASTKLIDDPYHHPAPPVATPKTFLSKQCPVLHTFKFEVITTNHKGEVVQQKIKTTEGFHENLGNGIPLEMVAIPGGLFMMGSPQHEWNRNSNESPYHAVEIAPFFMGKFAITQHQWRAVSYLPKINYELHYDPSKFKGPNFPVEQVTWYEAVEFCDRLTQQTGRKYRLPSEAEWEYACRAGTTTPYTYGLTMTSHQANYQCQLINDHYSQPLCGLSTIRVGQFPANAFGLHDMHGNVYEWCLDTWHENYEGAPTDGRPWVTSSDCHSHVLRGGSWYNQLHYCRASSRRHYLPSNRVNDIGFRVVAMLAVN